ncbi:MAG: (2Fe-2S)-binding protein, partial [Anaerolineales bacterium]|nr:(2Fe-2S)-binding protein [Anaerolineales bacterium]
MSDLVNITIDGTELSVPKGTLVVDAAKRIGVDIPVFCYHPKMEPVGMCRV